jgi:hypothetical protein
LIEPSVAPIKLHILNWAIENMEQVINMNITYYQSTTVFFCLVPLAWKMHEVAYVYSAYAIGSVCLSLSGKISQSWNNIFLSQ